MTAAARRCPAAMQASKLPALVIAKIACLDTSLCCSVYISRSAGVTM
jgi:hypothetical protein